MTTLTQRIPRTLSLLQHSNQFVFSKSLLRHASSSAVAKPRASGTSQRKSTAHSNPHKAPYKTPKPQLEQDAQSKPAASVPTNPSMNPISTPSLATDKNLSKVNGPLTTLPAPLETPTRSPNQSLPGYLFSVGKAYMSFYKAGGKNIYANFQASRPVQARINKEYNSSLSAAIDAHAINRHDFQLLIRNWHDVKRVPMFGLVLLICGEFTPLLVILFSNVVPWNCRIPRQIKKDRTALEERRAISFRNLTLPPPTAPGVKNLHRMQLIHISWSLGLSSRAWDLFGGQYPGLPNWILRRKVAKRVNYLELDDTLIMRDEGLKGLEIEELKMACLERGINVLDRPAANMREDLTSWLESRKQVPTEYLLLTRPSVWPASAQKPKEQKIIL